jgi:hypothetical protein
MSIIRDGRRLMQSIKCACIGRVCANGTLQREWDPRKRMYYIVAYAVAAELVPNDRTAFYTWYYVFYCRPANLVTIVLIL